MDLEQYVKIRCDLNNKNYKEIQDKWEVSKNIFKAIKLIRDEQNNIKYQIKYTLKDHGEVIKSPDLRYNVSIYTTFFVKRNVPPYSEENFYEDRYDNFSMYYYFTDYQHPTVIENMFENIWNNLNIFSNYPYLVDKEYE